MLVWARGRSIRWFWGVYIPKAGRPDWATYGLGTLRDGPGRFLGHSYGTMAHTAPKLKLKLKLRNQNKSNTLISDLILATSYIPYVHVRIYIGPRQGPSRCGMRDA
jgi:hypothetical protein